MMTVKFEHRLGAEKRRMRCSVVAHTAARSQSILGELKESCIQLRNNTIAQMFANHSQSSAAAAAVPLSSAAAAAAPLSSPSAAGAALMLPPSSCTSNRSFIMEYIVILADGRQKCTLCPDLVFAKKTASTNIGDHLEAVHPKIWKQRPIKKDAASTPSPIADAFKSVDVHAAFDRVVEMFIRHPGLPLTLCNSKHFTIVLKSSIKVNYRTIRQAVIDKDQIYLEQLKERLKGKRVGIQIDGGKMVDGEKIIGVNIVVDQICFCYDIVFVGHGDILSAEFYFGLLQRVVSELEALGVIVVSGTLDNEASPNAGMRLLVAAKPWIIHNRCYPHTAELMIEDLQSLGTARHPTLAAIPILHTVNTNVHSLVTSILNSKYLRAALFEAQRSRAVAKPLTLVKPANTRKWSTGFLMIARFCALFNDIAQIENYLAAGLNPDQSEIQAKRLWVDTQKLLIPSRIHCEAVRELLYWIYVGEQAMQKDGASVIHATYIFEEICCALETDLPTHRVPRTIQTDMDRGRVREIVQGRRELLQTSGIYWLSLVLWPKATIYAYEHHAEACQELETFITRCWPQWQRNRTAMRLPERFHCVDGDAAGTESKLAEFISAAHEELTEHLIPSEGRFSSMTQRHQASFESRSAEVAARLRTGDRSVKRGRVVESRASDDSCVHVHQYWSAVASSLPVLSIIARLLLACCASEAGVERMFSKEGFIHDSYRNLLQRDILLALVRSCINRHALNEEPLVIDQSDYSSDEE